MKKFLCLFLLHFGAIPLFAQQSLPPSPESMALVRAVNYPAGLFTGIADIQTPLYEIGEESVPLSIVAQYQASGIKVQDIASCIGLGWKLFAGGKITRVVNQYPDETGYCDGDGEIAEDMGDWTSSALRKRLKEKFDSEPDVFYYELGDRIGKFVFDPEGNAWVMPYQRLKIEWIDQSYFIVTDENGTKYTLGQTAKEVSRVLLSASDSVEYISTWHLEKIETLDGKALEFAYNKGTGISYTVYAQRDYVKLLPAQQETQTISNKNRDMVIKILEPYYLHTITWRSGKLEFVMSNQYSANLGKKLDEIKIYSCNNEYLKSIRFSYSYFSSLNSELRLRLDEIEEVSDLESLSLARFEYNLDQKLPERNSKDFDHRGYFNRAGNTTYRPAFQINGVTYSGANREADLSAASACVLKRRYNMFGGYEEYDFELNQADGMTAGGLRLKSITQYPGKYTTQYTYTQDGTSSGSGKLSSPLGQYAFGKSFGTELYGAVESADLKDALGLADCPVYYEQVTVVYPNQSKSVYDYAFVPDGDLQASDLDNQSAIENYWTPWQLSACAWKRGLLQCVRDYSDAGGIVKTTQYYYNTETGAKSTFTACQPIALDFSTEKTADLLAIYTWKSQPVFLDSVCVTGTDIIERKTVYRYHPDYLAPVEVTERAGGNTYKTTTTYPFDYAVGGASESDTTAYALKKLQESNGILYPVETVRYKNNRTVDGKIYEYRTAATILSDESIVTVKTLHLLTSTSLPSYVAYTINNTDFQPSYDEHYKDVVYADRYDAYGNLIQSHTQNGIYTSTFYAYNHSLPVAIVENTGNLGAGTASRQEEVFYTSFEEEEGAEMLSAKTGRKAYRGVYTIDMQHLKPGKYKLTYWKSSDEGETWECVQDEVQIYASTPLSYPVGSTAYYIDELSVIPYDARLSTCSYLPGVGKLSESDYNGVTQYYEYDGLGRLTGTFNNKRERLKEYQYHLQP